MAMKINDEKVNIWGRYFINDGNYVFDNVSSGIELSFSGTEITINCKTIPHERINPDYSMFTVLSVQIDDETPFRLDIKNEENEDIFIASGLMKGSHRIRILKTDDPLISSFCLKEIYTDGYFNDKVTHRYNMAVYGDSILSGGDNLIGDGPSLDVVPGTGDGTKTYASFAADKIDAEVNVLSRCGLCLYPASTCDTEVVISKIYNKVSTQHLVDWDLNKFIPDIVVVGLGTNDDNGNVFTVNGFAEAYIKFIEDISVYNPKALFILSYGYMDKDDRIEQGINIVVQELKNKYHVVPLKLPRAKKGHPSVQEHYEGSKLLLDLLNKEFFI